ncbi:hypothetical protein RY27_16535 [Litorilinea aerophila]|nr:hypothetical protein RY27_16535 [Litorilinea aerophila]
MPSSSTFSSKQGETVTAQTSAWEERLLQQALPHLALHLPRSSQPIPSDPTLRRAYRHCARIAARHSRSFTWASALLPPAKRQAIRALYAFCRTTDDLVDRPQGEPTRQLEAWEQRLAHPDPDDPVPWAWADTRVRHAVPDAYARQLIHGVSRDLYQHRYETFADLAVYCYGVASTVGLMSMHIVGFAGPEAVPYAVKLGVALQLTNILRDVAEDYRNGRIYLPQAELAAFGLDETDLARGVVTPAWRAFMQMQIARNRRLYAEAWPGIRLLNPDGRLAIAAAADLYRAILDDIEAHDYDVFSRRAHIGTWAKVRRVARLWLLHK